MCAKSFCIVIFTFLVVLTGGQRELVGQAAEKPVYKFEDTRISEADTLMSRKQYTEALTAYQTALTTYDDELFYEGMVYATERIAHCYRRLRKDSLSAVTFQEAINLAKTKLEPNHMLLSKAYLYNGIRIHTDITTFTAVNFIDSAMVVFNKSPYYERRILLNIVRYKFYTYYYYNSNRDTLIKYLDYRLKLEKEGNFNPSNYVYLLNDYAMAYNSMDQYEKAISYSLEAQRYCDNYEIPIYYNLESIFNLSRSLLKIRKYDKVLKVANQLISITLDIKPDYIEILSYYNLKAISLVNLKRYDEAIYEYKKILKQMGSENIRPGRKKFYNDIIMNLGIAYQMKGELSLAKTLLIQSLNGTLAGSKDATEISTRYKYLGNLSKEEGNATLAFNYYDLGIQSFISNDSSRRNYSKWIFPEDLAAENLDAMLDLLKEKSGIMINLFYQKEQIDTLILRSTLSLINSTHKYLSKNRERILGSESKLMKSNHFRSLYLSGLEASFNLYHILDNNSYFNFALENFSRSKSLLLLEQMGEYSLVGNTDVPFKIREEFAFSTVSIDSLSNLLNQQITIDPLGDSVMVLNSEKMKWNAKLAEARKTIEQEYPEAGNELLNEDISLTSLREDHQLSNQKALIEYFVGDSVIFVIGLSGEKESFHRIKKDKVLDEALSGFLGEVNTAPDLSELEVHLQRFGQSASTLYKALLQPVLNDLGDVSELVIVPDEILSRIPFEMLLSDWSGNETSFKELKYLLKDVKVSHLLSSKVSFNAPVENQGKGFLGFGYVGDDIVDERAEMGGLPGALKEINFLKSNFKGDYYMGKEGTKRQFLKKAGNYDVIHLALHGKSDSVNRYNSALVFNGERDFYMTSTDLYRTRLKSKLAVLSACESGIGKISEGEGSFSIARGFAIAGVPSIVTTLWRVNDEAGAAITQQFYLNLSAGDKKDEALRKAKLQYLEASDNLTASPYFWGSYILIGDTSTIELPKRNSLPWYWVLFTVVFLTGMGIGLRRLSRKPFDQAA